VQHNVPLDTRVARTLRERLNDQEDERARLASQLVALQTQQTSRKQELQGAAATRWPELLGPYTAAYQTLAQSGELETISAWLTEQPTYATLVEFETAIDKLQGDILQAERQATQLLKMLRLRRLATLKQQLYDYGTGHDIEQYETLVSCESAPLTQALEQKGQSVANRTDDES